GNVGSRLGKHWVTAGHEVMFGVREVNEKTQQIATDAAASIGSMVEAADYGEVVVIAIPGRVMADIIPTLALNGKIVIDATNGGGTDGKSGSELIAALAPGAAVYKAFNSVGAENLDKPSFGEIQSDIYYCGANDDHAEVVAQLIEDVGFRAFWVGDLSRAGMLETLARLWIAIATGTGAGRRLGWRLLTEADE
ncbi:MAG: NAD(P)-binding domain-containing protein, partial [Chloroflexota bacterium]